MVMEKDFNFGDITSLFYFYEQANPKEEEKKEKPTYDVGYDFLESGGGKGYEKDRFYSLSDAEERYAKLKKDKYVEMKDFNLEKGDVGYYSEDFKHPIYSIDLFNPDEDAFKEVDFYEDGTYEKMWGKHKGNEWEILNKELIKELKLKPDNKEDIDND